MSDELEIILGILKAFKNQNKSEKMWVYLFITWQGGKVKEQWLAERHALERIVEVVTLVELNLK